MRQVHVVGDEDGALLLSEGSRRDPKFRLPVDGDVLAAVRRASPAAAVDAPPAPASAPAPPAAPAGDATPDEAPSTASAPRSAPSAETSSGTTGSAAPPAALPRAPRPPAALTPREVQARVRRGEPLAEVAAAAGVAVERVQRWAAPVMAERAHVVSVVRSQTVPGVRPPVGLGQVVDRRLAQVADAAPAPVWEARQQADGAWTVTVTFRRDGGPLVAAWCWDPRRRALRTQDGLAELLVRPRDEDGAEPLDLVAALRPRREQEPTSGGTDVAAAPAGEAPAGDVAVDEVVVEETVIEVDVAVGDEPARRPRPRPEAPTQASAARRGARGGRAAVPAWDDVLFGARRPDAAPKAGGPSDG